MEMWMLSFLWTVKKYSNIENEKNITQYIYVFHESDYNYQEKTFTVNTQLVLTAKREILSKV